MMSKVNMMMRAGPESRKNTLFYGSLAWAGRTWDRHCTTVVARGSYSIVRLPGMVVASEMKITRDQEPYFTAPCSRPRRFGARPGGRSDADRTPVPAFQYTTAAGWPPSDFSDTASWHTESTGTVARTSCTVRASCSACSIRIQSSQIRPIELNAPY